MDITRSHRSRKNTSNSCTLQARIAARVAPRIGIYILRTRSVRSKPSACAHSDAATWRTKKKKREARHTKAGNGSRDKERASGEKRRRGKVEDAYIHVSLYLYLYTYTRGEREREKETDARGSAPPTVGQMRERTRSCCPPTSGAQSSPFPPISPRRARVPARV